MKRHTKCFYGQTAVEYTVVIGLLVVGSIGAVSLLGNTISDYFGATTTANADSLASAASINSSGQQALPIMAQESEVDLLGASKRSFSSLDGEKYSFKDVPTDVRQAVETTGANGTTESFSLVVAQVSQKLLDSGDLNEKQANLLLELASKGHEIAQVQQTIESAALQSTSKREFANFQVEYNGQIMTPAELADLIGIDDYTNSSGKLRSDIVNLQKQLQRSNIADPSVKTLVQELSDQIITIGDEFSNTVDKIKSRRNSAKPSDLTSLVAASVSAADPAIQIVQSASVTTNTTASSICGVSTDNFLGNLCLSP